MTQLSLVLLQFAKIANSHPESMVTIATQFAKIANSHPESMDTLATQFAKIANSHPESMDSLLDSISDGQLLSKQWLADQVSNIHLGTIFLCGGWYALLLLSNNINYKQCVSFDADDTCKPIADILHRQLIIDSWKFMSTTKNIHNIDYTGEVVNVTRADDTVIDVTVAPDTIINTSCEHIDCFADWWNMLPNGKLIIVQSNNGYDIDGHINCSASLSEFAEITPMSLVVYQGELILPKFTRFMRIGYK